MPTTRSPTCAADRSWCMSRRFCISRGEQVSAYGTTSGLPDPFREHPDVDGTYRFDLVLDQDRLDDLEWGMPGRHNVWNASAASAMALNVGVSQEKLREGLRSFAGAVPAFPGACEGTEGGLRRRLRTSSGGACAAIGSAREPIRADG